MSFKFDPSKDIPDLSRKVIAITGGNAGLGAEVVRKLAAHNPKCIYLCARSPAKAEALISEIRAQHPSAAIKAVNFNLSSLDSAKSAATEIIDSADRLDLLFLNAGVSGTAAALTKDGYEWQFGVNYVGNAYFAQLLMPLLLSTAGTGADVRVVHTASEAAKVFAPKAGIALATVRTDMAGSGSMERYGQSKLANVLFAKKLAQLYPAVASVPVHPGMVRSENYSKADGAGWFKLPWRALLALTGVSVEEGAKVMLWAAVAPRGVKSGQFYMPGAKEDDGGKYGNDQTKIDELWSWTDKEFAARGGEWPKL